MEVIIPGSPASLSSENSDSDVVNTSTAKVYFGQLKSPELKLAALVHSPSPLDPSTVNGDGPGPSSLRRSARLSVSPMREVAENEVAQQREPEEEEEEEEESVEIPEDENRPEEARDAWKDAPFPNFLRKDEPSSAIASRIMRAHDNPSPPPKSLRPSLTPRAVSKLSTELVFPPIPSSSENSDAAVESLLNTPSDYDGTPTPPPFDLFDMSPLPTPTIQRKLSLSPTPRRTADLPSLQAPQDDEADLISFDRSVLISPTAGEAEIFSPSPRHAQQRTVDDLLFSSPFQSTMFKDEQQARREVEEQPAAVSEVLLFDLESPMRVQSEEQAPMLHISVNEPSQTESTQLIDTASLSPLSSIPGTPQLESNQRENQATPIARLPIPTPGPSSAPRRSPRLSTIPLPTPQAPVRQSTPGRTPRATASDHEGSQVRKRRRDGSEKATRLSLTPRRRDWTVPDSDGSGSETDILQSPSKKGKRDRKRVRKAADATSDAEAAQRVASLSPDSNLILTTLVTSVQAVPPHQDVDMATSTTPPSTDLMILPENEVLETPVRQSTPPPPSTVQRPPPGVFSSHVQTPSRGSAATRSGLVPSSPVKFSLAPAPGDDPNRTPARRVPIKQVNDMSRPQHSSITQPSGMRVPSSVAYTPVFSRPPPSTTDPDRSPAKRIPIQELPSKEASSHLRTPAASRVPINLNRSRTPSAEQPVAEPVVIDNKPATRAVLETRPDAKSALPGPSSKRVFIAPTKGPATSNIAKPTQKAESRIPRPGATAKPANTTRNSKLPMPATRKPSSSTSVAPRLQSPTKAPLAKVARLRNSSSSGSDDSLGVQARASGPTSSRSTSSSSMAKRRREIAKPEPPRAMVKMRQVKPGMFGGPVKSTTVNNTEKEQPEQHAVQTTAKPVEQARPIKAREVVRGTLQDFELRSSSSKSLEALTEARARERAELERIELEKKKEKERIAKEELERERIKAAEEQAQRHLSLPAPSLPTFTFACAVPDKVEAQMDVDASVAPKIPEEGMEVDKAPQSDDLASSDTGARRVTRSRRSIQPTDVFGAVSTIGQPPQNNTRRRTSTGPPKPRSSSAPPNLVFSTNGLALKALTNNNTTRNQHYYTELETHVIRKPGDRPESPTMKLRTILEKQKEEQDVMRAERARRRRGPDASDDSVDIDMNASFELHPLKHRRGPGDEEDYETPVRPSNGRKTVKWDRGLEVSVFLDEIQVQPGRHRDAEAAMGTLKGCLTVFPNRAPLDDLGNPLNVDSPLNVVPEKVVVTKYVYDNDEEAQVFEPPKTRSKAKKK